MFSKVYLSILILMVLTGLALPPHHGKWLLLDAFLVFNLVIASRDLYREFKK